MNHRAALVVNWDAHERQARIEGPVALTPDADSDAYWKPRPHDIQLDLHEENLRHDQAVVAIAAHEIKRWKLILAIGRVPRRLRRPAGLQEG